MTNKEIIKELVSLQKYVNDNCRDLHTNKRAFIDDRIHDIICEIDESVIEDYPGIWDNSDCGTNTEMIEEND